MIKCGVALAAAVLILACAAQAGPSESMAFAIGMCSAQTDPQARLACYDQIAAKLKAGEAVGPEAAASPPPPAAAAVAPAPVPATPTASAPAAAQSFGQAQPEPAETKKDHAWYDVGSWFNSGNEQARATIGTPAEFGAETVPPTKPAPGQPLPPKPLDHITAKVTNVAFNTYGRFTVTLDNGQIWRQLEGDSSNAYFAKDGTDAVTISRGFLGSYNLVVDGHNGMYKVKRLQ